MKFKISQPQAIHQLGSRQNQEDTIFPILNNATNADRLFILCDGMGGHESGEIASGTVCKTISDYILSHMPEDGVLEDALLEEAINAAYAAVDAQDATGQKKMGTTLTFLCFHKGGCTAAHIGDSRIYHFRPSTNEILYRSRDHSLVYDLFEIGELTYDEMKTAKNKNVITRVIMAHQERPSKADIVHITNIEPGDYFYMCSDGMLEQMDDDDLLEIFGSDKTDEVLDNALKYSPEAGGVSLSLRETGKNAHLTVTNTCETVPQGDLNDLFDRFYRSDRSRNSASGGYGLGLSIAQAVVTAHRGKINVSAPDEHTMRFEAVLPIPSGSNSAT